MWTINSHLHMYDSKLARHAVLVLMKIWPNNNEHCNIGRCNQIFYFLFFLAVIRNLTNIRIEKSDNQVFESKTANTCYSRCARPSSNSDSPPRHPLGAINVTASVDSPLHKNLTIVEAKLEFSRKRHGKLELSLM
jgi:hypothetical protein